MKKLLLLLFLIFIIPKINATVFSVSTVSALHNASNSAQPGDIIEMTDGTWMDAQISFTAVGTAANPITLRAQTPGQVVLTGDCRLRIGGTYLIVTGLLFENCVPTESNLISFRKSTNELSSHCRLTETAIIDCNDPDITRNTKWVGIFGDNNEVDHCYLAGKTNIGTTMVVWSTVNKGEHHIHHNLFGPQAEGTGNGWESLRIGTSSFAQNDGSNLIEHNYFYQTDGEIETISGKSSNSAYRYNIFKDCKGGLTLRHGTDCVVEGNIFLGENKFGSYGVRVIDRNHTVVNNYFADLDGGGSGFRYPICLVNGDATPADNGYQHVIDVTVSHNTIVNCTRAIMVGGEDRPFSPTDCDIVNNAVSISGYPPVDYLNTPNNLTYDGNFFYRPDAAVTIPSSGFVNTDPQLMLAAGDSIFRPTTASPLLGAAVAGYAAVGQDFETHSRPTSNATVGADEISSSPSIDRGYYGPDWLLSNAPLPSELLDFKVHLAQNCVTVDWATAVENNVEQYEIERSSNGIDFEKISIIPANSESTELINSYQSKDCFLPNTLRLYYRLKTVDTSGNYQYSQVETVVLALSDLDVRVFTETDNSGSLLISTENYNPTAGVQISIYDVNGKLVLPVTKIQNEERFSFGKDWLAGYYVIELRFENGERKTISWIKK